jgi:type I restriction enzyme M protein
LSRNKANGKFRNRTDEILFIDARNMGHLINRRTREFSAEDIATIAGTYHNWRNPNGNYENIKGFCNSASIERVKELDCVLTPGRYVGLPDDEDDFDFNERFSKLKAEFEEQLKEETKLNALILENLGKVKIK